MAEYREYYRCLDCGAVWFHDWDDEDYNNDWTHCPSYYDGCDDFNSDEITEKEFREEIK